MTKFLQNFAGTVCLAAGVAASLAILFAFKLGWSPSIRLEELGRTFPCIVTSEKPDVQLAVFAAESHWLSMFVLEGLVGVFALGCATWTIVVIGRQLEWSRDIKLVGIIGMLAILLDAVVAWGLRSTEPGGFLSELFSLLPPQCDDMRGSVAWTRILAEPAGISLGVAMAATMSFAAAPSANELARRSRALKRLLYVASALFIVGIMMSRANFSWVLARWHVPGATVDPAAQVIQSGVIQSGVAYSALLAAFFLPARVMLDYHVESVVPEEHASTAKVRQAWLADNELAGRWQDDARQLFALLAPVLSAPLFEAIAKL